MKRKYFALLFVATINNAAYANTNMTNNPVANSSGSVTNLGVMNMPTRQFQNQVGMQTVVCQGDTLVIQPFVTSSMSATRPYTPSYLDPIYSTRDVEGATDADGNTIGDGDADNPGQIIGYKRIRTAQKDTYSLSPGISLSWNIQLDRASGRNCREAQKRQSDLILAKLNDSKLAMELGRLKTCGTLLKNGMRFKSDSKYAKLCSDIELISPPNTLIDHQHSIKPTSLSLISSPPDSSPFEASTSHDMKRAFPVFERSLFEQ